jgi:hypothetical protein
MTAASSRSFETSPKGAAAEICLYAERSSRRKEFHLRRVTILEAPTSKLGIMAANIGVRFISSQEVASPYKYIFGHRLPIARAPDGEQ